MAEHPCPAAREEPARLAAFEPIEVGVSRRILLIQPFAHKGGTENVLLRVLEGLDADWEPTVLLLQRGGLADQVAALGVQVETCELHGKLSVARFPLAARRLAGKFAERRFSLIHANGTKAALFACFLAPRLRVPLLWMKHGHDFDWWAPQLLGPRCDRIVCVSAAVASHFPEKLRGRVSVVHPGVPLVEVPSPASGTPPRVAFVGRLDPKKGISTLVEAIYVLRSRGIEAELEIVGPTNPKSPQYETKLRRLIQRLSLGDLVRLRGWIEDPGTVYRHSRVVAIASRVRFGGGPSEGTPLTLIEGMNHARPVVAPQEAGIAEVVGDCGTLVADREPASYADALEPYLTDPELAARVGDAARRRVESSLDVTQLGSQLEAIYRELAPLPTRFPDSLTLRDGDGDAPRIAVIIPCFNDAEFVRGAVESVQEAEPVELVVVDDGSTDPAMRAELDRLEAEGVRVLRHDRNRGIVAARMTGLGETSAPYVAPLDSDDLAVRGALGAMADRLDSEPDAAVAYGDYLEFNAEELIRAVPEHIDRYRLAYVNEYPVYALFRRAVLEGVSGWTGSTYEDWHLWLKLAERGYRGIHIGPGNLVYKRRVHLGRRGERNRADHQQLYGELRRLHPELFNDLRAARRESDMSRTRKVLYPIVYGGRRRVPGETFLRTGLRRAGVWTLRR